MSSIFSKKIGKRRQIGRFFQVVFCSCSEGGLAKFGSKTICLDWKYETIKSWLISENVNVMIYYLDCLKLNFATLNTYPHSC